MLSELLGLGKIKVEKHKAVMGEKKRRNMQRTSKRSSVSEGKEEKSGVKARD